MNGRTDCKVDRVSDRYGLEGGAGYGSVDDHLLARWTGAEGSALGYRRLTEWFNKRLLRRTYDDHGRDALASRVDDDYATLTGEDDIRRGELLDGLAADGVDGEALREDMVSWGTMRNHLRGCLDAEKQAPQATTDWEREQVDVARAHAAGKVEEALTSLGNKGRVADAEGASVEVQVQLACGECPNRVPFPVALRRGYVCERHGGDAAGRGG